MENLRSRAAGTIAQWFDRGLILCLAMVSVVRSEPGAVVALCAVVALALVNRHLSDQRQAQQARHAHAVFMDEQRMVANAKAQRAADERVYLEAKSRIDALESEVKGLITAQGLRNAFK